MSQIQINDTCIHKSFEKKLIQMKHDQTGLLPLAMLCPDCILYYATAHFFKVISKSTENIKIIDSKISENSKEVSEK